MIEREFTTWESFDTALQERVSGELCIFRGESQANYELRSRFGRAAATNSFNDEQVERFILQEFKRMARPFLVEIPADIWDWLSLAQHHGLPTRLLDWSISPLVGLYFVVREQYFTGDGVLYVLPRGALRGVDRTVSPFETPDVNLLFPTHISSRIAAQGAVLSVHPEPAAIFDHPKLERWRLQEFLPTLAGRLYGYGTTEAAMFPDLDGLARYLESSCIRWSSTAR